MANHYPDFQTRRELWYRLVDSNVIRLFREERYEEAAGVSSAILGSEVVSEALDENDYELS